MGDLRTSSNMAIPPPVAIPIVQGDGDASPMVGQPVTVSGVVTGVQRTGFNPGFFLQDTAGDSNPATSDGIYVRVDPHLAGWQEKIAIGRVATASGIVAERGGMTSVDVTAASRIRSSQRARRMTIEPEQIDVPVDGAARTGYLEAREGMLLTMPNALVVGPTNPFGQYIAVDEVKHGARRMQQPDRTGPIHVNGRLGPKALMMVGDRISSIRGPLGMTNGSFELLPVGTYKSLEHSPQPPTAFGDLDGDDQFTPADETALAARVGTPSGGPLDAADLDADGAITPADVQALSQRTQRVTGTPDLRIATMNAQNLFDDVDAPPPIDDEVPSANEYRTKLAKVAGTIRDRLKAPELMALQEVENQRVVDDLLQRPELSGLGYRSVLLPTSGTRSIHPVLLYRGDSITVTGSRQLQRAAPVGEDPLDRDVTPPASSPLFAREPLVVDLRVGSGSDGRDLTVIVTHLVSKFQPAGVPTDDVRIAQATAVRDEVERIRASEPTREVIVLGDMNDTPASKTLAALLGPKKAPTLVDATTTFTPPAEQYSFIYDGRSELIDHIMVTPGLVDSVERAGVRHGNADVPTRESWDSAPDRASDHDMPYLHLRFRPT